MAVYRNHFLKTRFLIIAFMSLFLSIYSFSATLENSQIPNIKSDNNSVRLNNSHTDLNILCTSYEGRPLNQQVLSHGPMSVSLKPFSAENNDDPHYYLAQESQDGQLALGANEYFRDYTHSQILSAKETIAVTDHNFHQEPSHNYIDGWGDKHTLVWALWFEQGGNVNLALRLGTGDVDEGAKISVKLNNQKSVCHTQPSQYKNQLQSRYHIEFTVPSAGFYQLELTLDSLPGTKVARLYPVNLTGAAVKKARVLRARWDTTESHAKL